MVNMYTTTLLIRCREGMGAGAQMVVLGHSSELRQAGFRQSAGVYLRE